MTIEQLSRAFGAKGKGRKRRAKCPCHKSRGLTLAIYDDGPKGLGVYCMAGCSKDDVLAAVGLSWKDLTIQREWTSPAEYRKRELERRSIEEKERNLRIGRWILIFAERGYSRQDFKNDCNCMIAAAMMLCSKDRQALHDIMRVSSERIQAAVHCKSRGILP